MDKTINFLAKIVKYVIMNILKNFHKIKKGIPNFDELGTISDR